MNGKPARMENGMITLGYPVDPEPRPKRRKSLAQIRSYNRYQTGGG